jgi:hypothetical protein
LTAAEVLAKLRSLDVQIWADNEELYCNGPRGALTAELRAALTEHKAEILALLGRVLNQGRVVSSNRDASMADLNSFGPSR